MKWNIGPEGATSAQQDLQSDNTHSELVGISLDDIGELMAMSSEDSVPADKKPLDYGYIFRKINYTGEHSVTMFSPEYNEGIFVLGVMAARLGPHEEVPEETFGWGYYLYAALRRGRANSTPILHNLEQLKNESIFERHTVSKALRILVNDARDNSGVLFNVADDLLDGIIQQHFSEFDYGEDVEASGGAIREGRLYVVRAGIGLAYRHDRESSQSQQLET